MIKISAKSKLRVIRLMVPPTDKSGVDLAAPSHLTIRRFTQHARFASLRRKITVIRVDGDHLLSVSHLVTLGFDFAG